MDDQREAGVNLHYLVSQMRLSEEKEEEQESSIPLPRWGSDPRAAGNLLQKAFRNKKSENPDLKHNGLPFVNRDKIRQRHEDSLVRSPLGRDFTLVTASGVEFKIHSTVLIGGPKMLLESLYPGGAPNSSPPTWINLPPHFHPGLVDQMVDFLYRSWYLPPKKALHHASYVPDTHASSNDAITFSGDPLYMFHLRMYALAEDLEYDDLMTTAHRHLYDFLINGTLTTMQARDLVVVAFAPLGSAVRICKDDQGFIKELVAVSALVHDAKKWDDAQKATFAELLKGKQYAGFWDKYNALKEQNEHLISSAPTRPAPPQPSKRERKRQNQADLLAKKPDGGKVKKSERFRKAADGKLIDRKKTELVVRMLEDM